VDRRTLEAIAAAVLIMVIVALAMWVVFGLPGE
jgi:hypothetical protein